MWRKLGIAAVVVIAAQLIWAAIAPRRRHAAGSLGARCRTKRVGAPTGLRFQCRLQEPPPRP